MKKMLLITFPIIAVVIVAIALYYNNTRYYFDFDEVVYYKTTKDFDDFLSKDDKQLKTLKDSIVYQIMGEFKKTVPYDEEAVYLDSIGFEKKILPASAHAAVMEIFREKLKRRTEWTTCTRTYRDIYVFKKKGKISGMAKLCYECGDSRFYGTNAKTEDFGMDGEFGKLYKLVK